ncbi:hypothetical protein DP117_35875 [Brasilonema sp. UFV-L1]|nr:hypothetical protein [Brasilonema sp. UFV-L1]
MPTGNMNHPEELPGLIARHTPDTVATATSPPTLDALPHSLRLRIEHTGCCRSPQALAPLAPHIHILQTLQIIQKGLFVLVNSTNNLRILAAAPPSKNPLSLNTIFFKPLLGKGFTSAAPPPSKKENPHLEREGAAVTFALCTARIRPSQSHRIMRDIKF